MSVHIALPKARRRARVPAHIAAPEADAVGLPGTDSAMRAPEKRFSRSVPELPAAGGPSPHCRAPYDAEAVPADALPLWNALREVMDPELPISVVDMGLIYDLELADGTAVVTLTYTATGCPCVDFIRTDITERLLAEPDVDGVVLHEVWSPAWTRAMMSEEGRAALREFGVAA